jgi:hypothetical protein
MAAKDSVPARRLDQVDRRSQVGVSGALRARDVSRPDDKAIAEAEATELRRPAKGAARPSSRTE